MFNQHRPYTRVPLEVIAQKQRAAIRVADCSPERIRREPTPAQHTAK